MDFMTTSQAAIEWDVSRRRVSRLCADGRIKGATQIGNRWLVPIDTLKPDDQRGKITTDPVVVPKAEENSTDWISYINSTLTLPKESKYTAVDLFAGCGGRI